MKKYFDRDLEIVNLFNAGNSGGLIAAHFKITRSAVLGVINRARDSDPGSVTREKDMRVSHKVSRRKNNGSGHGAVAKVSWGGLAVNAPMPGPKAPPAPAPLPRQTVAAPPAAKSNKPRLKFRRWVGIFETEDYGGCKFINDHDLWCNAECKPLGNGKFSSWCDEHGAKVIDKIGYRHRRPVGGFSTFIPRGR
jgi:hypothetical protein